MLGIWDLFVSCILGFNQAWDSTRLSEGQDPSGVLHHDQLESIFCHPQPSQLGQHEFHDVGETHTAVGLEHGLGTHVLGEE